MELISNKKQFGEKQVLFIVIGIFIISCIIRVCLALYDKTITIYSDEIRYWDIAKNIATQGKIIFQNSPVHLMEAQHGFLKILYCLLIAPAFWLQDPTMQINAIAVISGIAVSSTIIPAYLIAREIKANAFVTIISMVVVAVLPDMVYSMTFMSETMYLPITIWLIYFMLKMFTANELKPKIIWSIAAGAVCYLTYLTKEMAYAFLIAYVICVIASIIFTRKNIKMSLISLALFVAAFGVFYVLMRYTVFAQLGNSYSSEFLKMNTSFYGIMNLIYGFFWIAISAILGFFYFPLFLPGFKFKNMEEKEQKLYVYIIVSLIIFFAAISFTITTKEDYGDLFPRQHLRYFFPLFIPLVILFFKLITDKKEMKYKNPVVTYSIITGITVFVCAMFAFMMGETPKNLVDQTMLMYYNKFVENFGRTIAEGTGEFTVNTGVVIFQIGFIAAIIAGTFMFLKKNRLWKSVVAAVVIISICLCNNYIAVKRYRALEISPELKSEVTALNDFLQDKEGNILVIAKGITYPIDSVLDTHITVPTYHTSIEGFEMLLGDSNFVDLKNTNLTMEWPIESTYKDLKSADYIITDKAIQLNKNKTELLDVKGVSKYFDVYKNLEKDIVYKEFLFPRLVGEKTEIYADNPSLHTQFEYDKDQNAFVSGNSEGILVFGPYDKVVQGTYNLYFHYDYEGDAPKETIIGKVDLNFNEIGKIAGKSDMLASKNVAAIENVTIDTDNLLGETRMHTLVPGVKFKKVEIEKIK